jgi:hypothetical protein
LGIHIPAYYALVDALIVKSYIQPGALGFITDTHNDNKRFMSGNLPIVRSIFLESRRFRLVTEIDNFISSQVTERPAPLVRLEGPDIALSGRQILLKPLT